MGKDVSILAQKAIMVYISRKKCRKVGYGVKKSTKGQVIPLKISSSFSKCSNLADTMHCNLFVGALVASSSLLVYALPSTDSSKINAGLRLIKTSEADPGIWVTEDEKIEQYTAKNINFIDITDITVCSVKVLRYVCSLIRNV